MTTSLTPVTIILTCCIQQLEDFVIGGRRDGCFSLKVVGFDAIAGGDAVLALDVDETRTIGQIEHPLRLAFDHQAAQFCATLEI